MRALSMWTPCVEYIHRRRLSLQRDDHYRDSVRNNYRNPLHRRCRLLLHRPLTILTQYVDDRVKKFQAKGTTAKVCWDICNA
jgi:hypothetical protein